MRTFAFRCATFTFATVACVVVTEARFRKVAPKSVRWAPWKMLARGDLVHLKSVHRIAPTGEGFALVHTPADEFAPAQSGGSAVAISLE
jgi:hypothetical protein